MDTPGSVLGVIVIMQNKVGCNRAPPKWYCIMNKNLPVLLRNEGATNDQITKNDALDLQRTSPLLQC